MAFVIPQTRNDIEVHQQPILCGHFAAQSCGGAPCSRGEWMIRTVIVRQTPTCQCEWNEQHAVRCAAYRKHPMVAAEDSNQDVSQGGGGAGRAMVSTRPLYSFTCHFVFQARLYEYITFQNQNVKKKKKIRHLLSLDFLGDTIQGPGSWMLDLVTRNLHPSQAPPGFLGVWDATHSLRMDLGMKSAL